MDVEIHQVVRELKERGRHHQVAALCANLENQRVVFSGSAFFYIDAKRAYQILEGVLPVLKRSFWPHTNMTKILKTPTSKGVKQTKKRRGARGAAAPVAKKANIGKGRFFGSIQGKQVHSETEDFILLDEKNFRKKHGGTMHDWTRRLLMDLIGRMRLYPIQCEFKVGDLALRMGTAIDMICVNPATGHLVFLELKTGHADYFENTDGTMMRRSLKFLRNSPLNWANVQLTTGVLLLLRQNPTLNLDHTRSYVVRIDDQDLFYYALDNEFIRRMRPILLNDLVSEK